METPTSNPAYVVNEISLVYNRTYNLAERPDVNSSRKAAELLREFWDLNRMDLLEQFRILLLSSSNRLLGTYECSTGGTDTTVVDPRLIFACALKANARKIVICHNHPSGNLKPSQADLAITQKLISCGKLLEILVIDHIILSSTGFFSFADEGLM